MKDFCTEATKSGLVKRLRSNENITLRPSTSFGFGGTHTGSALIHDDADDAAVDDDEEEEEEADEEDNCTLLLCSTTAPYEILYARKAASKPAIRAERSADLHTLFTTASERKNHN